ncbi:MAG: hypothetical protein FJ265_13535 [Planctomycetes bacterium]|nr:hypothetical protein [Planctomycetota bacterium]
MLFAGVNNAAGNYGDTWEWDGTTWTPMTPAVAPSPRRRGAMIYDSVRGVCVLYSGYYGSNDTWEWNGSAWTQRSTAHSPGARDSHAMTYDPLRQRIVLFGGSVGVTVNDTWEFDGNDWQQRSPATRPSPRVDGRIAFMASLGKVVLFGGWDSGPNVMRNDTWTWDGTAWVQLLPATNPPARAGHGLARDSLRGRLVLFGGTNNYGIFGDTWEFDGVDWQQRAPGGAVAAVTSIVMTHDPARGVCTVFGGWNGSTVTDRTYEYGPVAPASSTPFGAGCAGTIGMPTMSVVALPWLGSTYQVAVTGLADPGLAFMVVGWSNTNWALGALPYGLAALTPAAPGGCDLLVSPDAVVFLVPSGGVAAYVLATPGDPAFLGALLFHQVVQFGTAANEKTVSAGARMQFGSR